MNLIVENNDLKECFFNICKIHKIERKQKQMENTREYEQNCRNTNDMIA